MSRRTWAGATGTGLVVALLVFGAFVGGVGPAAAQSSAITVSNASVTSSSPEVGETFVVQATIKNAQQASGDFDVSSVYVQKPGGRSRVARELGTLAPGTQTTVQIPVTVDEPGWHTLSLRVTGSDADNPVKTIDHPIPVRIQGTESNALAMAATADDLGPSDQTDLHVTVANGFNQAITGVTLQVDSPGMTLPEPQRVASRLPPGNQSRFSFPVRDAEAGEYTVDATLTYTSASGDRRTIRRNLSTVVSPVSEPGRIELTGVDVTRENGHLVIRGSASNVGTTDVSSVNVSVVDGETAGPAESSATYFVGTVPASDFSSFNVRAEPTGQGNVTVPIRVGYVVDGVRTSRTVEVDHRLNRTPTGGQADGGGGGGLGGILVIGGLLLAVVGGVLGWRRYSG